MKKPSVKTIKSVITNRVKTDSFMLVMLSYI
ncbi:Uncharacterised protein [Sebaldella termitidis]|uniref:Uncharacterized protein n=1 Tax=Sebaldella termitidis (strain ATCC 33386 / NCTC 11300) TaxID=526218 RepID=D1AHK2_SEBTE|nr:hypothetical protein Sterm_1372 [Sebaldella termitidis ATCC 33386]SUI23542.1 Uncharacterised protein [Sebaldella termitidis]